MLVLLETKDVFLQPLYKTRGSLKAEVTERRQFKK
jgi:hypothetical protein